MKKFLVAGILGTMLMFTKSAQVAHAHDRCEPSRPSAYGYSRYSDRDAGYRYRGHDDDDYGALDRCELSERLGCGTGVRNPWPTYESSYHYRPYSSAYRYNGVLHYSPRLSYANAR